MNAFQIASRRRAKSFPHPRSARGERRTSRRLFLERLETRMVLAAPAAAFAPGEILIGFEGEVAAQYRLDGPGKALQSAAARYGGLGIQQGEVLMHRPAGATGQERLVTVWRLPPGKDPAEAAGELSRLPGVGYAEPNYLWSIDGTQTTIPNDPQFGNLWGMHNTGQSGGVADADIDAPEAWSLHTGTGNAVVAVIDTGVAYGHKDLAANIWTNPGEVAGNGIDDDGNGYVDDMHGYDFVNNDGDPNDDNNHGTHVAGTIGATGNNGTGVVGVNWNVQIMALKFLGNNGSGTTDDAIRAVNYATQMRNLYVSSSGARGANLVLTNNSWNGPFSQAVSDAIAANRQAGMLFIAAAGNAGSSSARYPAGYGHDNIISVAATDRNDQLASFSNYGTGVDLAAPGVDVYSTVAKPKNGYNTLSGTSMATPHVAGAAALLADYLRTSGVEPTYEMLRDCLFASGDRIAATLNTVATGSRINAHGTLLCGAALTGEATQLSLAAASVVEGDAGSMTATVTITRSGRLDTVTEFDWSTADGTAAAGSDYAASGGHVIFAPGETSKEVVISVFGDTEIEPNESFQVVLSNVTNRAGGSDVAMYLPGGATTVTISNDDEGLISWWTADNTAADAVGSNHGALVSGATYAPGQIGQALRFDGVDDRVGVADAESLKLTNSMTIEGWVRVDSVSTTRSGQILFRGDDRGGLDPYALYVDPNGTIRFLVTPSTNAGVSIGAPVPVGQFVHVAATLDDATGAMRLYLNGVLMAQTVTTARPFGDLDPASNPGIGIGNHGGYPATPHNFPFHGLIDELKVYNFALSTEEVLDHFNAGKGDLQPTLSINDVTITEGDPNTRYLGNHVSQFEGGLYDPHLLIYGPDGALYVSTRTGNSVLRYDAATGAPRPAPGKPGAEFVSPGAGGLMEARGIAFGPDGNLYVVSTQTNAVLRYDAATGDPLGALVAPGSGGLDQPRGLLFHSGYLYVTSVGSNTPAPGQDSILRFDALTGAPAGKSGAVGDAVFIPSGDNGLDNPSQIVVHNGDFYIASTSPSTSNSVLRYRTDGTFVQAFVPTGSGGLAGPVDLAFHDGFLYVTSWSNNQVLRYDGATGAFIHEVVAGDGLARPIGVLFEPNGSFLVASGDTNEIRRYGSAAHAVFTVTLSAPFSGEVSVSFATGGGDAVEGSDYSAVAGTITFAPGQTKRTIIVPTLDDAAGESAETFFVNLTNAVGAAIVDGVGIGTILDNDAPSFSGLAAGESHTFGTVSGDYTATHAAEGQVQTLTEEKFSGGKRSRLEHAWRFDGVPSGGGLELAVLATHLNNTGAETFSFAYSTDNATWTTLGVLSAAPFPLPGSLSGTVYIRVTDTDRSNNEATQDALAVDHLTIRAASAALAAGHTNPQGIADPPAVEAAVDLAKSAFDPGAPGREPGRGRQDESDGQSDTTVGHLKAWRPRVIESVNHVAGRGDRAEAAGRRADGWGFPRANAWSVDALMSQEATPPTLAYSRANSAATMGRLHRDAAREEVPFWNSASSEFNDSLNLLARDLVGEF